MDAIDTIQKKRSCRRNSVKIVDTCQCRQTAEEGVGGAVYAFDEVLAGS